MKKTPRKAERTPLCLADLITAVSKSSRNQRETIAAVADLLESGRVRLQSNGRLIRARVL